MAHLPKGVQLFALAPKKSGGGFEVLKVDCALTVDLGEDQRDEHDDTCLEETEAHSTLPGLLTPGEVSFTIKIDAANASHGRLDELDGGPRMSWALGWDDGIDIPPAAPAAQAADWELPNTRTWQTWQGHISAFNVTGFEVGGAPLQGSIKIKRATKAIWLRKGRVTTP